MIVSLIRSTLSRHPCRVRRSRKSLHPQVVANLEQYAKASLEGAKKLRAEGNSAELTNLLDDVSAMAYLGRYYARKIEAATALAFFSETQNINYREKAVSHLEEAAQLWDQYRAISEKNYRPQMLARTKMLDWTEILEFVKGDVRLAKNSPRIMMLTLLSTLFVFTTLNLAYAASVEIRSAIQSKVTDLAISKLNKTIALLNQETTKEEEWLFELINAELEPSKLTELKIARSTLKSEAFQILKKGDAVYIVGGDERGLMYGILDVRDQLEICRSLDRIKEKSESPRFRFRAIKFNLPWSSYRLGESLQLHMETVKDTLFWVEFLDMMADNRFNALTLWNLHPYTFMIQPKAFPEATQFTGREFAEWRQFWKTLFRMAKERGIETYIVNWNIITSPQMTEAHNVANYKDDLEWHYGFTPADTSQIIVDYMRECITQVINEYPNLTGVGVSIGERMKMPIEDAMQWVKNTFVEGIKRADRKAKFIHRAPFSIDPEVAREYVESYTEFADPIIMEFKFNWSHAHSSPHLSITHGGRIKDQYWNPKPTNYQMAWMMRNEDFLMLNWGSPDFILEHMAVNGQDFVAGYFVGSETYIPAKEFRIKEGVAYNWRYAFEKQWEFYQMWGRLLYNPDLANDFFADQFALRYGKEAGSKLFEALQLGSRMPLALASFYQGTWDFTLYC